MEFRTKDPNNANAPVTALRINWVYRPRDVLRFTSDTRLVYATMHSDVCPLTSLRGKCFIKHRSEFDDLEKYRKQPDHFYFSQAHDRFIHRWYEVIPTKQVVNVPKNVKKALDERWKYIIVEASKVKELTSAVKSCKRCADYCGR
jgi:BAH domain